MGAQLALLDRGERCSGCASAAEVCGWNITSRRALSSSKAARTCCRNRSCSAFLSLMPRCMASMGAA